MSGISPCVPRAVFRLNRLPEDVEKRGDLPGGVPAPRQVTVPQRFTRAERMNAQSLQTMRPVRDDRRRRPAALEPTLDKGTENDPFVLPGTSAAPTAARRAIRERRFDAGQNSLIWDALDSSATFVGAPS